MNAYHGFGRAGIGNTMKDFCQKMMKIHPEHNYFFINWTSTPLVKNWLGIDYSLEEICVDPATNDIGEAIKKLITKKKCDVYVDFSPMGGIRENLKKNWFGNSILVCIFYDLIPYMMRTAYYFNDRDGYISYLKKMKNLKEYDHLFCISKNTRNDVIVQAGINKERTSVMYLGGYTLDEGIDNIYNEHNKPYYLMFSGNVEHKNTVRTILAYCLAYELNPNIPDLIILGHHYDFRNNRFYRLICNHNVQNKISIKGYVSDYELISLRANARWIIYTSLYEGFGLPIIDAWKAGVPVMTSNCTSMKEISEGASVLIDPLDIDSIKKGFLKISNMSEEERNVYVINGLDRVQNFTWENSVSIFITEIDKIISKKKYRSTEKREIDDLWIDKQIKKLENELGYQLNNKKEESKDYEMKKNAWGYRTLNRLMISKEMGQSISAYFLYHNYMKIAIYGLGFLANHCLIELYKTNIEVKYAIDQSARGVVDEFPIYHPSDTLPEVDAILITIYDDGSIRKLLSSKMTCEIVTIDNIMEGLA